ncbi:hypothetical protein GTP90_05155 [Rugamonas sp. FT81W]|uniref:Uncharacterized protein n=2 Tax=Duganella vulcania TaxID=2692166 RepID=A0A845GII7_9BURK|nr:hypothetical protein [Duganella vulcania]
MVLTDDTTSAAPIEGGEEVPFQRHGGALEEDGIGEWSPTRHLVQCAVAVASYDFKSGKPIVSAMPTVNRQGNVPVIESSEYTGALGFADHATGEALARLRLTGHFDGAPNRGSGATDEFLVVEVRHINGAWAQETPRAAACLNVTPRHRSQTLSKRFSTITNTIRLRMAKRYGIFPINVGFDCWLKTPKTGSMDSYGYADLVVRSAKIRFLLLALGLHAKPG